MSRKRGDLAEEKAVSFLQSNGYRILERNYTVRGGEIDIIAFKDSVLHFVEVKSGENFDPAYSITPVKMKRIIHTAYSYMKRKNLDFSYVFDAILIKSGEIEMVENITF